MYFDDLRQKFGRGVRSGLIGSDSCKNFADAILFRIEKLDIGSLVSFWQGKKEIEDIGTNNLRLPFSNFALQIGGDRLVWISSNPLPKDGEHSVVMMNFSKNLMNKYLHIASPDGYPLLHNEYTIDYKENKMTFDVFGGIDAKHYKGMDYLDIIQAEHPVSHSIFKRTFNVSIFLIFLLNCKNITKIKNKAPNKVQHKRLRRGKLPLVSYYTLVLDGKNSKGVDDDGKSVDHNRIHLCRGHFKHYTEEKPLFGKYTGLWWWQPSVRGQNKKGVIVKDYELKA